MRIRSSFLALACFASGTVAAQGVNLGNNHWPPFILEGEEMGTAETLVCEAMSRSGRECKVETGDWEEVLGQAQAGELDGIAAAWHSPEREQYMLFSEPYLTNRLVPVVRAGGPEVRTLADLAGMRVAIHAGYAYGEEFEEARKNFQLVEVTGPEAGIAAMREGRADVALVDELVAKAGMENTEGLVLLDSVLVFRQLYLAVSRQHPEAEAIIADFHTSLELMLRDGTVNEILAMDWIVTDLGNDGSLDLVLGNNVSMNDLTHPLYGQTSYTLDQDDYQQARSDSLNVDQLNFHYNGEIQTDFQSTMSSAFGRNNQCKKLDLSSTFSCSLTPKPRN